MKTRTRSLIIFYVTLLLVALLVSSCTSPTQQIETQANQAQTEPAQLANPASENCVAQGGTLAFEERGDEGQFGVCYFEDNLQCEEWALMRGDCPVGGVKVTGYITEAARYCAITGGEYAITGNNGADDEQGTCSFKDGSQCNAWEYYDGGCTASATIPPADTELTIQPLPEEVCNGQAQAMSHVLDDLVPTQSEEPLDDPINNASGSGCQATITGTGVQFESPRVVVSALGSMLEEQGWTADPLLAAGGPTGAGLGYRNGDQICRVDAIWHPDDSANCPQDEPVSTCELTPEQQNYTVTLNCGVESASGETAVPVGMGLLVFDSTRGGGYRDLYTMKSDGYDMSRLTRGEADSFAGPWSPDGQRIVFTTYGLTNSLIAVINADGSGQSPLVAIDGSDEGFPDWSLDGTRLAFTSRRDGNNEIYLMDADGSNPVRLTNEPGDDFAPSWSPDGTKIVFVSDRDQTAGVYDLYIMNADGSGVTRLTDDTDIDYSPDWSPDGQQIVFRSHHDGPGDIYVINVDGSGLTNLTNDPADDWAPTWSPDGSQIAFQSNRDGNWEIYVMAADGSSLVNLTNDPGDDQMPYWQPAEVSPIPQLVSVTDTDSAPTTNVPLKDALGSLEPQDVFQNFYDITQIPRQSGQMDQIREFLVNFGEGLGLETVIDDAGNVIIRRPATAGFEDRQGVVLQAHMDMVPQKVDGKEFDFNTDPIPAFVNGDYIVTDGTTLGADNGIGIAMIMAILQSKSLQAGPLEALFTVDEESTLSGAHGLKPDTLKSRLLINMDSEEEGIFTIGSAGGERANVGLTYSQAPAPADALSYVVKVQGLQGGHSGIDINKGRGHATRLLVRLLKGAEEPYGLRLASISGGTASNAIPRDATAVIFLPVDQVDAFTAYVKDFEATIQSELAAVEPSLTVQLDAVQPPAQVMDLEFQHTLLAAINGTPQGVARMSDAVSGLVETSNNLGIVDIQDGQMQLASTLRSSVDSQLKDMEGIITSVWELAGYPTEITDWYGAWTPNPDSPVLGLMQSTYRELFGVEAGIMAVHAGLECGAFSVIYPDMDMISIGPNLNNVHSPSERLHIPSVEKVMALLTEVLSRVPDEE